MMIIITGVSGGLGGHLAQSLAYTSYVIGTYNAHEPDHATQVAAQVRKVDVTDPDAVEAFARWVIFTGQIVNGKCVLINLAGVSINGMGHKLPVDDWGRVLDTNLRGAWLMSRAILPAMRASGWGRIINVTSVVGQMGVPGTAAYAASKAGIEGMTRALAAENAAKGITVNALALGYFDTGMIHSLSLEAQEEVKARIPMGRFGNPENVAAAIRFLIRADYVTGATININGGLL